MKELFIDKNFFGKSRDIIDKANKIIADYQRQGFTLTLRQLYYQFVARDWLANKQSNYDRLGAIISDARLAGLIDWDAIEDRTRYLRGHSVYNDPAHAIEWMHRRYRIDMWEGQTTRLEVWIEKDALVGVVADVCAKWDISYFACRGYASQSELYAAGKRIEARRKAWRHQNTIVVHLGDHDPSGIDMTRDNCDRLSLFAGGYVHVERVALNMNQVKQYDPPPNPAKVTDSRFADYESKYGEESWELDALEPSVIAKLIDDQAYQTIDMDIWQEREAQWEKDKVKLQKAVDFVNNDTEEE